MSPDPHRHDALFEQPGPGAGGGQAPPPDDRMTPGQRSLSEALALSLKVLRGIMVVVVILFIMSGFFQVDEGEVAVVLRFGRIRGEPGKQLLGPGPHWVWPYPVEERLRFPVKRPRVVRCDVFWRRQPGQSAEAKADEREQPKAEKTTRFGLHPRLDGYSLTGDLGIIHTGWIVRYQVHDVIAFLKNMGDPPTEISGGPEGLTSRLDAGDRIVEDCLRNAVVKTAAAYSVDDIYRLRSEEFRREVERRLNRDLERLSTGLLVPENGCQLDRKDPPTAVRDAFEDVVKAEQDKERMIGSAEAERQRTASSAAGEAAAVQTQAELYRASVVQEAESDARNLALLLEKYKGQPEALNVFLRKRLMEAVGDLLTAADEKFVIGRGRSEGASELRILVNRDPLVLRQRRMERIKKEEKTP